MATIRFYGDLQRFGRQFNLSVSTATEAVRALCIQIPGLRQHLAKGHYKLRVAREDATPDSLPQILNKHLSDRSVIHLVPVIGAAKSKYLSIVAGAVLVVAGAITGNPGLVAAGVGLMAGGVAGLLTPVPNTDMGDGAKNGNANKYFSSLDNRIAQGSCVPLIYGEVMVGSKVLSQGLRTV